MTTPLLLLGLGVGTVGAAIAWTNNTKLTCTGVGALLVLVTYSVGPIPPWSWVDLPILVLLAGAAAGSWWTRTSPLPHLPPTRVNGYLPSLNRSDGVLTLACYAVLAWGVQGLTWERVQWVLRANVLVAAAVAVIALLQWRGRTRLCLGGGVPEGVFQGRAWGTMCNPMFLGGYLCLTWPLSLTLREWWALLPSVAIAGALLASGSRAAWGAAVAVTPLLWVLVGHPMSWAPFLPVAAPAVSAGIPAGGGRIKSWFRADRFRLATTLFDGFGSTTSGRRYIWAAVWALVWTDRWTRSGWIGHGYNVLQVANPDPNHRFPNGQPMDYYDNAHSNLIQTAYQVGWAGTAAYLTVWALALWHGGPVLAPALVCYFLWAAFGWDHVGPANLLWVLLSAAAVR